MLCVPCCPRCFSRMRAARSTPACPDCQSMKSEHSDLCLGEPPHPDTVCSPARASLLAAPLSGLHLEESFAAEKRLECRLQRPAASAVTQSATLVNPVTSSRFAQTLMANRNAASSALKRSPPRFRSALFNVIRAHSLSCLAANQRRSIVSRTNGPIVVPHHLLREAFQFGSAYECCQ
jgi:hypothetical protein